MSQIEETEINKISWGKTQYYTEADFSNTSVDPFGYQAEWEQEKYEIEHSPSKEQVIQKLEEIKDEIQKLLNEKSVDELTIKTLIFVTYSISEGFTKKVIIESMPIHERIGIINDQRLLDKLYSTSGRQSLYLRYKGKELDYIPYYREIRNPLSHDILKGIISQGSLFFDEGKQAFPVNQIIENLLSYVKNLME